MKWYENPANASSQLGHEPHRFELIKWFYDKVEEIHCLRAPKDREFVRRLVSVHGGQIVPKEEAVKVVLMCNRVEGGKCAVFPCPCRKIAHWEFVPCCIGFTAGIDAGAAIHYHEGVPEQIAKLTKRWEQNQLTEDEAEELFTKFNERGWWSLVSWMVPPYIGSICNCEVPTCLGWKTRYTLQGNPTDQSAWVLRSHYIANVDIDNCTGCRRCLLACQFGAIFVDELGGRAFIDPRKCTGCGLCRTKCEENAITLIDRETDPIAANYW